jgi:hypothetical protein
MYEELTRLYRSYDVNCAFVMDNKGSRTLNQDQKCNVERQ